MAKPLTLTAQLAAANTTIDVLNAHIVELKRQLAEATVAATAAAPAPTLEDSVVEANDHARVVGEARNAAIDEYAFMCGADVRVPVKTIRKSASASRVTQFTKRDGSVWEKRCTGFNQFTSVCVTPAAEVAHA